MPPRITVKDLTGLKPAYANFVIEYVKDFSPRRAAEASGFAPSYGAHLAEIKEIDEAIKRILTSRLEISHIDAEWLLMEAVDNHMIARSQGNIASSNTALGIVAKHKFVDAFAAEKVEINSDKDIMERLIRGRNRANNQEDEDVSFL